MNTPAGKGSKPRPKSISEKQFAENWDRIFKKDKKDLTEKKK